MYSQVRPVVNPEYIITSAGVHSLNEN